MKSIIKILIGLLPILSSAHDMSLHMSIGAQTFDVWQEFDPAFYNYIITPAPTPPDEDSVLKMLTYKFYYIGLTFPDMLWSDAQSIIRGLINKLYEYRGYLKDPLYIQDHTKDNVQTAITFAYGDNSHNLAKLYQMVNYAKNHNWTPYEKSLIYGAFMHVVQDMYATFQQASRFGFGKCFDSDSALSQIILRYAETYHELFSQTYITNWGKFVIPLYMSVDYTYPYPIFRGRRI